MLLTMFFYSAFLSRANFQDAHQVDHSCGACPVGDRLGDASKLDGPEHLLAHRPLPHPQQRE